MSQPFYIACSYEFPPKWGYMVKENCQLHRLMTEIIKKSISVMKTQRSRRALKDLALKWALTHGIAIDPVTAMQRFQRILEQAERNHLMWPVTIMDWLMDDLDDANTYQDPWDVNGRGQEYPIQDDVLALNGVRVYYLLQDTIKRKPTKHVRKFELIWAVVHELAHIFVSHLSFVAHGRRLPRLSSPRDVANPLGQSEAGYSFERILFGGNYLRGWDGSQRGQNHQPGLPLLEVPGGDLGIPLSDVIRIANKDLVLHGQYTDEDITLHPVKLNSSQRDGILRFPSFYAEYYKMFKTSYVTHDGEPEVTRAPDEVLKQLTTIDVDAMMYRATHPDHDD